ncbi:hypothetical protein Dsin_023227 [Dipteronia sinensis]|uniref:Uncharacterized protein n=1 Tax=Dipteronia sinensis TaxID=43782 RepID=A0AAE0E1W3_9ROSI|nr:hypothetical protein Dsin_023227 [Dipteronia sinensis]
MAYVFKAGSKSAAIMKENLRAVVGNGNGINFWEIKCGETNTLKESFPRIFALAVANEGVINDFGDWKGASTKTDSAAWLPSNNGVFSVSSFCRLWNDRVGDYSIDDRFCWQGFCPPKVELLVWRLLQGRIMVKVVLNRYVLNCSGNVEDARRKFLWEEMSYLERWWRDASVSKRESFTNLVKNGQLEIVGEVAIKVVEVGELDGVVTLTNCESWEHNWTRTLHSKFVEIEGRQYSSSIHQGQVIEVVSDSLIAVTWINSDNFGSFAHVKLVYDIRDLLKVHGQMAVRFCSRSSNSYADDLAKKGSNREGDITQWGNI